MSEIKNPRKFRWLRLSIRGLIVLVLLIGGGLGWLAYRARVQKEAVAAIVKGGGTVTYDIQRITDPRFKSWAKGLADVVGIDTIGTVVAASHQWGFTDADMKAVERLTSLEELWTGEFSTLTDAGLANLGRLTRLKSLALSLRESKATRAFLPGLEGLRRLEELDVRGLPITDAHLSLFSGMTRLRELFASGPGITDAGMARVAGIGSITWLGLENTAVTDASVAHLVRLNGLEHVGIVGTRVTDAGLLDLARRGNVTDVNLDFRTITREGSAAARLARPGMTTFVFSDPPTPRPPRPLAGGRP